jgi:hypothetical protein
VSAFRRDFSRFSASSSFFSVLPSRLSDFAASSPNFSRPFEDQDRFARTVLTVRCASTAFHFGRISIYVAERLWVLALVPGSELPSQR